MDRETTKGALEGETDGLSSDKLDISIKKLSGKIDESVSQVTPDSLEGLYDYTITITLSDFWEKYSLQERLIVTKSKLLQCLKKSCKFVLVAELTELHGRLHYHGIIKIVDRVKWYRSTLPFLKRTFGYIQIKKVDENRDYMGQTGIEGWVEYMAKDLPITEQVFSSKKILFDHNDKPSKIKIKQSLDLPVKGSDIRNYFGKSKKLNDIKEYKSVIDV